MSLKKIFYKTVLLIFSILTAVYALCSCGSDLDGTWRSCEDEDTRIKFSGENVSITYDEFSIEGTYEIDDNENIIFHLTDKNGSKYKITAKISTDSKYKILTLTNPKGDKEVFKK